MKKGIVVTALICMAFAASALADTVTNTDLLKMLDAKLPESVVLQVIGSKTNQFDTSPDALIKLQKRGASPAVLQAVLGNGGARTTPSKVTANNGGLNAEEVILAQGGVEETMQYIVPNMRTAARAFGFGGIATYAALPGPNAVRRLAGDGIEFIVSVPKNAQAVSYISLANFAIRKNGTREVATGGGYMSYSSGITKDRVVSIDIEAMNDQSRAPEGFVLHKVMPAKTVAPGEYALVLYTSEVHSVGILSPATNSFYDFGVN